MFIYIHESSQNYIHNVNIFISQANHIDIAPNFAGILMGITNAAANVCSIVAPLFVGFIINNVTDPAQWRIVFFISAGIYFFGNLMFVLFSSTEIQVWNDPDHRDRRKCIHASRNPIIAFIPQTECYLSKQEHAMMEKNSIKFCVLSSQYICDMRIE